MKIGFLINHEKQEISPLFIEGGISPKALEDLWNEKLADKSIPNGVFLECIFDDEPENGTEDGEPSVSDIIKKYNEFCHYTSNSVSKMLTPETLKDKFVGDLEALIQRYKGVISASLLDKLQNIANIA